MRMNIRIYFTSYSASLLGNSIATVVLPLVVLARTGDVLAAGVVASVTAASSAIAGVLAGVVIDRVNRRTVSIVSDLVSASAMLALPIVDALWGLTLTWFLAFAVLGAFGDAPGMTAREALLPRLVQVSGDQPGMLDRLVGLREATSGTLLLAGPGLGGLLLAVIGVEPSILYITAGTSFLAAVLSVSLDPRAGLVDSSPEKMDDSHRAASARRVISDLRAGWAFLLTNPLVRGATVLTATFVAVIAALQTTLMPAYFTAVGLPGLAGLALTSISVGGLAGAGVYTLTVERVSRRTWFIVGMLGTVVGFIGLGTMLAPWIVLVSATFIGLTNGPVAAALGVATIEATPDHMRGRVLGAQNALTLGAPVLAAAPLGAIANASGLGTAGIALAAIIGVIAISSLVSPAFRHLDGASPAGQDGTKEG